MKKSFLVALIISVSTSFANSALADPAAYWSFDEGTGSIAYDSVGDNDGTISGAAWASGIIDGALNFDGLNNIDHLDAYEVFLSG